MELVFIRHGKTKGNMQSRYIGTTDEGLCKEGINELRNNKDIYPKADIVFTSPMKRCIQTAEVIYPGIEKLNPLIHLLANFFLSSPPGKEILPPLSIHSWYFLFPSSSI